MKKIFNSFLEKFYTKQVLHGVSKLIKNRRKNAKWIAGKNWVQYSGPYFDDKEYVAAVKSLMTEWMIFGKQGRKFELEFAKHLGKEFGVLTNSGSSANLLMVSALKSQRLKKIKRFDIKDGAKFITPVVCFPTTINPLIQNGYEPVFVDVTLPNLHIDLDQVEDLLKKDKKKEIKGLIFAHVLGNPPNMDRVMSLVKKYNLIFLEDSCDALGSTWKGEKLGSFGDISTCSFFPAHHMTMGEGGFVATNNNQVRLALASLRDWGRACYCNSNKPGCVIDGTACGQRFNSWFKGQEDIVFDHRYIFDEIGYNIKPLELQACMGLEQLKKLDFMHNKRKENFNRMYKIFSKYEKLFYLPTILDNADVSWFGFLITLKDGLQFKKNELVDHLEAAKIQTRSYFTGNALFHPAYIEQAKKYKDPRTQFPNATKSTVDTFFMGVWPGMTDEQLDYIEEVLHKFLRKY
jgi:CDP-6-deoxy-D-xylo-4-hexulose-3-dehydrase